jgi:type I restriction-modification system DNA methylase subunit
MNIQNGRDLVDETFHNDFEPSNFAKFITNLLGEGLDRSENFSPLTTNTQGDFHYKYNERIESYEKIGSFADNLDVLIVKLQRGITLQRGRTTLREFAADYLIKGQGLGKSGVLAAFYSESDETWRFSYVKIDVSLVVDENGRVREAYQKSEAKRFSFLVGRNEKTHTARKQFIPLLTAVAPPTVEEIEKAFSIEVVTDDFFHDYKAVFEKVENEIKGSIPDKRTNDKEAEEKRRLFTQRLFNRLMFIYFLQKKGWLSFEGDKNYLRRLYNEAEANGENFYHDRLRWLFFSGLGANENIDLHNSRIFRNRRGDVPYLNGGLFEMDDDGLDEENKVKIENQFFCEILDLFELYNFTVDESTPLDVELAVDPEMLGKVFEELVTGRHDTGSYYTPRQVVQFMCRESLKSYLAETSVDANKIKKLVEEYKADDITLNEAKKLLYYLENVKIVDPACGSGAYLLGTLQELKNLTALLDTRSGNNPIEVYDRKLKIIQNNLYGVDKDAFAVQIARLRVWLSLAVDFSGERPEPLPNLDFKIEQGDSLTAPNPQQANLIAAKDKIEEYKKAKAAYFKASLEHPHDSKYKEKLLEEINELRDQISFWVHSNRGADTPDDAFDWAIEFAEVFSPKVINWRIDGTRELFEDLHTQPKLIEQQVVESTTHEGGFDIVLANPPYGAKVADNVRDLYFDRRTEGSQSKDTYGLFMARGLQMLRPGGVMSYIVSDTWRTIKSHKPLRQRILEQSTVKHFLDLPPWIFNATVNTCILTISKQTAPGNHTVIAGDLRNLPNKDWRLLEENLKVIAAHGFDAQTLEYARYTYPQSIVATYENLSFFVASPELYLLLSQERFAKLGDIADVKVGLQTGDNRYYLRKRAGARGNYEILDESKLLREDEITNLSEDEKLNGIDPRKYGGRHFVPYEKGGESDARGGWLPNYHVPTGYFIDWSKEAVHRLKTFCEDPITLRGKAVIRNPSYYFKDGITFSDTGFYAPTFRLNSKAVFDVMGMTVFSDSISVDLLLSILVSRLARYLIKNKINHTVHTQVDGLKLVPIIPERDGIKIDEIKALVTAITEKQKANQSYPYHQYEQKEIETLIYELYALTPEQIREVEIWYCRRYARLAEAQGFTAEVREKYKDYFAHCELLLSKPPEYWTSHPITQLIAEFENQHLDFKECYAVDRFGNPNPESSRKTLKTIASFINAGGGTVLIGVEDSGKISGIQSDLNTLKRTGNESIEELKDKFQLRLQDTIRDNFNPTPTGLINYSFAHLPEGIVCQIDVQSSTTPTYYNNKIYVRNGRQAEEKIGHELTMWIQERTQNDRS